MPFTWRSSAAEKLQMPFPINPLPSTTSTASPASKLPSTSVIPTGSELVPPSRSACAAPASTMTRPCAGSGVLEPQLEARVARLPGREAGAARLAARARHSRSRGQAARDHRLDAGGGRHLRRADLRRIPPEPRARRRDRCPGRPAPRSRSPPRSGAPRGRGGGQRCTGPRCRWSTTSGRRPGAPPPGRPAGRCRRTRSHRWSWCRSR